MTIELSKEEWFVLFQELNERINRLEEYIAECKKGEKIWKEILEKSVKFDETRPVLKPSTKLL